MNRAVIAFSFAALLASDAVAATVIARTQIDSPVFQEIRDSVSATSSQLGIPGPDDLGIDQAFASADIPSGELRFRALDGIQTNIGSVDSAASAFASMRETLTFSHDPSLGALVYQFTVDFTSTSQVFDDRFPLFNQPEGRGIGGRSELGSSLRVLVLEERVTPGAPSIFNTSAGNLQQTVTGFVAGQVADPTPPTVFNVDVDELDFGVIGNIIPGQPSQVLAVDTAITASASTVFEGSVSFDLLVNPSLTLDIVIETFGVARGGFGTYAGVASLNTARASITLPEGGSFTSGSGLFLTAGTGGVAPVPLPHTGVLLLTALAAAPLIRRRRAGQIVTKLS